MGARAIFCSHALLPQGWRDDVLLELDDCGGITAVHEGAAPGAAARLSGPVVPGMPNLHSHGFQALIAGLTGRRGDGQDTFWTWREAMYRVAERLEPDDLEDCMAGVFLRMLRAGYTSCGEFHYLHHAPGGQPYANPAELGERVVAAARTCGIALTLLPVLYCRSGFGATTVGPGQSRFANTLDAFLGLLERCDTAAREQPLLTIGVAPHSLRAVDAAALSGLLSAAGAGRPVHMHVAEQQREVDECLAHSGARPVEWLLENHPLDSRWCLVHATHTLPGERSRAAAAEATVGLCPTTEADLGDGIFEAEHWANAGGCFGIGSDSNLRISVREELRLLEFTQRLRSGRRNVMADGGRSCGRFLYETAAFGGGRALGQPVGRMEAGRRADLVELDAETPGLAGLSGDALLDSYIFAGDERMISSVWVAGKPLILAGRHEHEARIEADFARVMRKLRS